MGPLQQTIFCLPHGHDNIMSDHIRLKFCHCQNTSSEMEIATICDQILVTYHLHTSEIIIEHPTLPPYILDPQAN